MHGDKPPVLESILQSCTEYKGTSAYQRQHASDFLDSWLLLPNRDNRNLLQRGPFALGIRLPLPRGKLLDCRARGRRAREILGVDPVHLRKLVQVIEIHITG